MIMRLALALVVVVPTYAYAGGRVKSVSCGHAVVVAAPAVVAPPVYATVAPQYQQQAQAVAGFRQSPEWAEYQQLIGYRTAVERVFAAQQVYEYPEEATGEHVSQPPAPFEAPGATPPTPSAAPCASEAPETVKAPTGHTSKEAWAHFRSAYPLLNASCSKCHASEDSKGGFDIARVLLEAKAGGDCETLRGLAKSVTSGRMPKGSELTAEERLNLVDSILEQPATFD